MIRKRKKAILIGLALIGVFCACYPVGLLGQWLNNYSEWVNAGGIADAALRMRSVDWDPFVCVRTAFSGTGLKIWIGLLLAASGVFLFLKLRGRDREKCPPRCVRQ